MSKLYCLYMFIYNSTLLLSHFNILNIERVTSKENSLINFKVNQCYNETIFIKALVNGCL